MTDRPILFSAPMVRALLDGRKTATRRVIKARHKPSLFDGTWADSYVLDPGNATWRAFDVPYATGQRLWVREAWRTESDCYDELAPSAMSGEETILYDADADWGENRSTGRSRRGFHMPRWASRLTLEVTGVKVERVASISADDALAEGIERQDPTADDLEWYEAWAAEHGIDPATEPMASVWIAPGTRSGIGMTKEARDTPPWGPTPEFAFRCLWDSINGRRPGCSWADNPWVCAVSFAVHLHNIDQRELERWLAQQPKGGDHGV